MKIDTARIASPPHPGGRRDPDQDPRQQGVLEGADVVMPHNEQRHDRLPTSRFAQLTSSLSRQFMVRVCLNYYSCIKNCNDQSHALVAQERSAA
jgi:hypothetical protein